jgi:imidazolonepropionase-like amidohydrolase
VAEGLFESVDVFCENVGFSPRKPSAFQAAQALGIPVKATLSSSRRWAARSW